MQVRFARQRPAKRIAACTAEVVLGDAVTLPWRDGRFSAVVCRYGLELMPDPARALAETHRVPHPGGRAVLTMGIMSSPARAPGSSPG